MNKVEIADRLQKCFSSVVHDVMRDEGLKSFTLPSSITPTKENYNFNKYFHFNVIIIMIIF